MRLIAIVLALVCHACTGHAKPMNTLVIIADDLGWADIGANNPNCFYDTPALDRFAATGANFSHAYAASPVCSPTRASIMTGIDPSRGYMTEWFGQGVARSERFLSADRANSLPNHSVTIAERLREAGYQTFFAGKWHLGGAERHRPEYQGFDINIAGGRQGNPGRDGYFAPYRPFIGLDAPEGEHLPARLTDETIAYIEARDPARPFLAVLSYYSVHTPLQGRDDLVAKYRARRAALGYARDDITGDEEQVWPDRGATRAVRVVQDHAVYAAMVEAMDEQIGRLIDTIDRLGLAEDTLIMFVSDNGGLSTAEGSPTSNRPLRGGKGWLYEGGIRVPMMARWPGVLGAGETLAVPVHTNDIAPSICDAAGLEVLESDGVSLRRAVRETAPVRESAPARALCFHYPHYSNQGGFPGGAVIEWPWKLIQRYEDGRVHLYNIEDDISEERDLAATDEARVDAMTATLHAWLRSQNARFLSARPGQPEPWTPDNAGR